MEGELENLLSQLTNFEFGESQDLIQKIKDSVIDKDLPPNKIGT